MPVHVDGMNYRSLGLVVSAGSNVWSQWKGADVVVGEAVMFRTKDDPDVRRGVVSWVDRRLFAVREATSVDLLRQACSDDKEGVKLT